MSCQTLVHELGGDQPNTIKEFLDITTRHISSEEAVGVVFVLGDGTMVPDGSQGHRPRPLAKALRKVPKEAKREKRRPYESQLRPAMATTMTRKRMTPMRSMSRSPNEI
jgi:hypothetical protein